MRFYPSSNKLQPKVLIGNCTCSYENVLNSIKNSEYEFKQLLHQPHDFIVIDTQQKLITCNLNNSISVYDLNDFKETSTVTKLNGKEIAPVSITNSESYIYMCDPSNDRIYQTDFNLNLHKQLDSNNRNNTISDSKTFGNPIYIYYHKTKVYVCDHKNKQIKVLSDTLVFLKSHDLPFEPKKIKIVNKTAVITQTYPESVISIYNLEPNFNLKQIIENSHANAIWSLKIPQFIAFDADRKMFLFYNEDGSVAEEINYKTGRLKFKDETNNSEANIEIFVVKNQLFMTSSKSKELLII